MTWRSRWRRPSRPPTRGDLILWQLSRIEWKLDRLAHHWTRLALNSPISGPTEPTSRSSTDTITSLSHPLDTDALLKHGKRWLPKLIGWLAERLFSLVLPSIISLVFAGWTVIRHYGTLLWQWLESLVAWCFG